jgi:hypothetical protein
MTISFNLDRDENINNFRVAEAVVDLCEGDLDLNAEAIAKMILVQVNVKKSEENR